MSSQLQRLARNIDKILSRVVTQLVFKRPTLDYKSNIRVIILAVF